MSNEHAEPSGANGEETAVEDAFVAAVRALERPGLPAHPEDGNRDRGGRFRAGNLAALKGGARSAQRLSLQAEERHRLTAELLRDRGFTTPEDAPLALRLLADGCAQAALLRDSAMDRMAAMDGPLTAHDRKRDVFDVWTTAAAAVRRDVATLGLERHTKDVASLSLEQYLAHERRQREQQP